MIVNLHIENSIIKLKLNVQVLEVQLNTKLQWDLHFHQIEANHVIKMLMLNQLKIFIWEITFAKVRQIYSVMIRLKMTNVSICKEAKIQFKCEWLDFLTTIQTSECAIAQFYKSQWDLQWKNYKKRIADINAFLAQRSHLFKKSVKMRDDFQKIENILAIYIRIKHIKLKIYLHSRNMSSANNFQCDCEWSYQTVKHILMHCLNWTHLRLNMLWNVDFMNYWIIISITKSLKTTARMMMKTKLLKQFKVTRTLIL